MERFHEGQDQVRLIRLDAHTPPEIVRTAQALLREYGDFVDSGPAAARCNVGSLLPEIETLPESYLRQGGGALVALTAAGEGLGFVAWRPLGEPPECSLEVKRLWVREEARGHSLGKQLMLEVVQVANSLNISTVVLDTCEEAMPEACRLYAGLGFAPCECYRGKSQPGITYMRLCL